MNYADLLCQAIINTLREPFTTKGSKVDAVDVKRNAMLKCIVLVLCRFPEKGKRIGIPGTTYTIPAL